MANLNACSACACPHSKLVKCTLNMVDICVVVMHAFTLPGQWITFEPSDSSSLSLNYMSTSSLASQTHFRKKRSGEVHMQPWSHRTVQCNPITSHDTLHHCLNSNNGFENSNRELGHLHATAEAVNTSTILFGELAQHVFQECIV